MGWETGHGHEGIVEVNTPMYAKIWEWPNYTPLENTNSLLVVGLE